jgi:hypothetical protein
MVSGRLRTHDRDQIAKEMIEWSKLPDSINLNKFCAIQGLAPSMITAWAREEEFFRLAYEESKANLGYRREELLAEGKIHVKAYDLNATTYDHFMKDDRRQTAEFESKLKSAENVTASEADIARHEALMKQLAALQDRKIDDKSISEDAKS